MLTFVMTSFSAIFSVMDPFGVVPVFLMVTNHDSAAHRRRTAFRACLVSVTALLTFALLGAAILDFFAISLGAFRIAGGVLLFLAALDMLRAQPSRQRTSPEEEAEGMDRPDASVFPLAFPMMAGPGSIATVMLLMGRAQDVLHKAVVLTAIAVTGTCTFGILLGGTWAERHLGKTGLHVLNRVMGLMLAAIAVQFVVDGVRSVVAPG